LYDVSKRAICWNQEALKKLMRVRVKLVGTVSTIEIIASDLLSLLVLARSLEWKGADHLFQQVPVGFASTLQDGQRVNDPDASALSAELWKIHKAVEDRNNPMLIVAESLAKFAAMGGFTIHYEAPISVPLITPPAIPTPDKGSTRSPSAGIEQPPPIEQAAIPGPPGGW